MFRALRRARWRFNIYARARCASAICVNPIGRGGDIDWAPIYPSMRFSLVEDYNGNGYSGLVGDSPETQIFHFDVVVHPILRTFAPEP